MSTAVTDIQFINDKKIAVRPAGHHLFGPILDFLLLGGGSILALLILRFVIVVDMAWSVALTLAFANIINHPHFAHSYQIFYKDFRRKITSYPADLRWRYIFSGLAVPVLLAAFFTWTVISESPNVLGIAANAMFFFVGWHYVKQGYGMAMVEAVLKKAFYSEPEKKALLYNAYAVWVFSWLLINNWFLAAKSDYFGITYFAAPIPFPAVVVAGGVAIFTTLRLISILFSRCKQDGKTTAWNGLIAYSVSLYVWLLVRDPIFLLWIPMFHSLQYLTVVWRFELNKANAKESVLRPGIRVGLFIAIGFALGYIGFWALPQYLSENVAYSREIFGGSLFLFIFWIFINVHHYFLDSVMWRRGNPDVQKHLFAHQSPN